MLRIGAARPALHVFSVAGMMKAIGLPARAARNTAWQQMVQQAPAAILADGLGAREIGRKLKLSHTMVIRHRRKIASLLTRLELPSPTQLRSPHPNGSRINNRNGTHGRRVQVSNC